MTRACLWTAAAGFTYAAALALVAYGLMSWPNPKDWPIP